MFEGGVGDWGGVSPLQEGDFDRGVWMAWYGKVLHVAKSETARRKRVVANDIGLSSHSTMAQRILSVVVAV
jgi:hypothetical protein